MAKVQDGTFASGDAAKAAARTLAKRGNELGQRVVVGKLYNAEGDWEWKLLFLDEAVPIVLDDGRRFEPDAAYASKSLGQLYAPNPARSHSLGVFDVMVERNGCPLASLLGFLRALFHLELACHWQTRGETYYADHLLFQRLYEETEKEIDPLAERTVGIAGAELVDPASQLILMAEALDAYTQGLSNQPETALLVKKAALAELIFLEVLHHAYDQIKAKGKLSMGVDSLLQGMADTHEGHMYLLRQRSTGWAR